MTALATTSPRSRAGLEVAAVRVPRPRAAPSRARRCAGGLIEALGVGLVTLVVAALALRLRGSDLRVPLAYPGQPPCYAPCQPGAGDASFHLMVVKNLLDSGGYYTNEALGAPGTQETYDFPPGLGDNWTVLQIRALGALSHDVGLVTNLFVLLTFLTTALATHLVLRRTGRSRLIAGAGALVVAFLPYHLWRVDVGHLFLASYAVVPLALAVVVAQLGGRHLLRGGLRAAWSRGRRGELASVLAVCVFLGSSSLYYAAMTLVLLVNGAALVAMRQRRWGPLLSAFALSAVVGAVVGVNLAPSVLYARAHGSNDAIARAPADAVTYGLSVTQLVLPREGHRIEALGKLKERALPPLASEGQSLGTLPAVGFVALLALALAGAFGASHDTARHRRHADGTLGAEGAGLTGNTGRQPGGTPALHQSGPLALLTVVGVLVASSGGLALLTSLAGLSVIRSWNRMSLFLAVLAVMAVTAWTEELRRRLRGRAAPAALRCTVVLVVAAALVDQTSRLDVAGRSQVTQIWRGEAAFVASLESQLPVGASVMQLPYEPFPEPGPLFGQLPYDGVRPSLHAHSTRWSYGAAKGRGDDWQSPLFARPLPEFLTGVLAVGFDGLVIDRAAYRTGIVTDLRRVVGPVAARTPDSRWAFLDLRSLRARLPDLTAPGLRELVLHPVAAREGAGLTARKEPAEARESHEFMAEAKAVVELSQDQPRARRVTLKLHVSTLTGGPVFLTLTSPSGTQREVVPPGGGDVDVSVALSKNSGSIGLQVTTGGGEPVPFYRYGVRLDGVTEEALQEAALPLQARTPPALRLFSAAAPDLLVPGGR